MGKSYPDRTNATGIWKLSDIYKNKISEGTYPQQGAPGRGFAAGGNDSPNIQISVVTIKTAGNSTDFGDLISSGGNATSCRGNSTRVIFIGGSPAANTIQYITPTSTGNAADFGDLSSSRFMIGGGSNTTRAVNYGGQAPSAGNVIDFMTIPTLGNATDFGDATQSTRQVAGNCNPRRAFMVGGDNGPSPAGPIDRIEMVEMSTTGNGIDFGDLVQNTASCPQGCGSFTRGLNGGGQASPSYFSTINSFNYDSLGNATDFGDLTQARRLMAAFGDTQRGCWAGGITPSANVNTIDFITIASAGTATDFGDLNEVKDSPQSGSDSHQGLEEFFPRAPELYSPTGKVVPRGGGQGDIGVFGGGETPGESNQTQQEFISISTLGNGLDFGDASFNDGTGFLANTVRFMHAGHSDPAVTGDISTGFFSTKGNNSYFGDMSVPRYFIGSLANDTRGLFSGGEGPSGDSNIIDYVTHATLGNAVDFGDLQTAKRNHSNQIASTTRGVMGGGQTPSAQEEIDYVTIASTGDGADFGNLSVARGSFSATSSSVRGVWGAGSNIENTMDYITIASTGNATDFGNLTESKYGTATVGNSTRGVWGGGRTPSFVTTMDFVTIASTGNAADFGDLDQARNNIGGSSNGHGGLS